MLWSWLRALRPLPCIALLALTLPTGCDDGDEDDDHHHADEADETADTSGETGEVDLANGQAIHEGTCLTCHPANGIDLEEHIPEHTDVQLFDVIDLGEGDMPAQDQLSDQDIHDVIAYLRSIYG
ncbi:c-type cytochrome [Nannocystaceae bacterium ST9]